MSEQAGAGERSISIRVDLTGADEVARPAVTAYAFGPDGRFVGSADVSDGAGTILLEPRVAAEGVRVYVGPPTSGGAPPQVDTLRELGSVMTSYTGEAFEAVLDPATWKLWLLCDCLVRGRVVKSVTQPDGTVVDRPVCKSRVHIYQVRPWWWILRRIPDRDLLRLKDVILHHLQEATPLPHLPSPPDPAPDVLVGSGDIRTTSFVTRSTFIPRTQTPVAESAQLTTQTTSAPSAIDVSSLSSITEPVELRRYFVDLLPAIQWWLCWWDWLEPWFFYSLTEIAVVDTDDDGYFSTTIYYPCWSETPNLYFKVEQGVGGVWNWVYQPPVRCNTWWEYQCGTLVTLEVTDPSARTCEQGVPVNPPEGIGDWVMPVGIGGLMIRGYGGTDDPTQFGWVRTDGLQEDGLETASPPDPTYGIPFGASLSIRLGYEVTIPDTSVTYYRLSWRERGTGDPWHHLTSPVFRYYEKHLPGHLLPSFPVAQMGPFTEGGNADLFSFRPHNPPGPSPTDPPGTTTNWPAENYFGDIWHGFLDTVTEIPRPPGATGSFGEYEVGLELFDSSGNPVALPSAAVSIIFPDHVDSDGTIEPRLASGADFDGAGTCVFPLRIDNRMCEASIGAPTAGGLYADQCGMLHHGEGQPVGMTFHAWRPGGYANFSFSVVRGLGYGTSASTSGEVIASSRPSGDPSAPWSGSGAGDFSDSFPPADLLGTCPQAAFAANLYVAAKVTNGFGRFTNYDASATIAFALVE
jgi:hypothetical protein